jgi:formylmethanofuran dehydrogenase subunit E
MADFVDEIYEQKNIVDDQEPLYMQETKKEVVNGAELWVQNIHLEGKSQAGVLSVIDETKYLCQDCGLVWVIIGQNAFVNDKKILCKTCAKKEKLWHLLKPLWSLFIKFDGNK